MAVERQIHEQFLNSLATIEFEQSLYDPLLYTLSCPQHADGRYLLKILARVVEHPKFTRIRHSYRENGRLHDPICGMFRFEIEFRGITISIKCAPTRDQPGNANIESCYSYDCYHIDIASFASYFDAFLQESDTGVDDDNWKLAVLLLFEIARRIPADDIYHDIPVALGIVMGLEIAKSPNGTITATEYFDLFRSRNREGAYYAIKEKYEDLHGALTVEKSNELLAKFGYPIAALSAVRVQTSSPQETFGTSIFAFFQECQSGQLKYLEPRKLERRLRATFGSYFPQDGSLMKQAFLANLPNDIADALLLESDCGSFDDLVSRAERIYMTRGRHGIGRNVDSGYNKLNQDQVKDGMTDTLNAIAETMQETNRILRDELKHHRNEQLSWSSTNHLQSQGSHRYSPGNRAAYQTGNESRSQRQGRNPLCWFHETFGNRARNCAEPCSYRNNQKQNPFLPRR